MADYYNQIWTIWGQLEKVGLMYGEIFQLW